MADKAKGHKAEESETEQAPRYAQHQDDSGFEYSPGLNPAGVGPGAATPFRQPAAYRGEGDALHNNATLVGDYSRRQQQQPPPELAPAETAAQTPTVSGTGVAAGPSGPGSAGAAAPAASTGTAHGQAGTAANP